MLYRELGIVERKRGDAAAALQDFTRASDLDPTDASSLGQSAEVLEERQDYAGAEAAYRKAATIEPGAGFEARAEAAAVRGRATRVCRQSSVPFRRPHKSRRGDLGGADWRPPRSDLADGAAHAGRDDRHPGTLGGPLDCGGRVDRRHAAVRQPHVPAWRCPSPRGSRQAVSALLALIAQHAPVIQAQLAARPAVADVSPSHLNYPAIAAAVSAGCASASRWQTASTPSRAVSGAEATAAIDVSGRSTISPAARCAVPHARQSADDPSDHADSGVAL